MEPEEDDVWEAAWREEERGVKEAGEKKRGGGEGREWCGVVMTGSMNPIHEGHLAMAQAAVDHLLLHLHLSVACVFFSPSHPSWSLLKPHGSFSPPARLSCLLSALRPHPFIRLSPWELSQPHPIDYPHVLARFRTILAALGITKLFYLCGSDHAIKCGLQYQPWALIVVRPGTDPIPAGPALRVPSPVPYDVSSTMIRHALKENDLNRVRHMLPPSVFQLLTKLGSSAFDDDEYYDGE